jgi:hypothetical protein
MRRGHFGRAALPTNPDGSNRMWLNLSIMNLSGTPN